jgi:hypothetical protein
MINFFKGSILSWFLVFSSGQLTAQNTRSLLFEDMSDSDFQIKCFCKPGVQNKSRPKGLQFYYNIIGPGNLESDQISQNPRYTKFRKVGLKLALPIFRHEKHRAIISYSFHAEQYEFKEIENDFDGLFAQLNDRNFKSNTLNLFYTRSLNEKNYLGFSLNNSFNGDHNGLLNLGSRYHIMTAVVAYGIKKNDDNEWGIGLAYSNSFRNRSFRFLPFIYWYKNFNSNWGLESTLPSKIYFRYNHDPNTILLFGYNYNGESYSFNDRDQNNMLTFNHNELQFLVKLERKIVDWIWLDFAGGYQYNFDTTFENQTEHLDLLSVRPGGSAYLRIGFFLSPPDSFLNKKNP